MNYNSVWKKTEKNYPELEEDIVRDLVVIGGGIAGFLTAFKLAGRGYAVTLLEADKLFCGTTGKTTAKITYNQGNVYYDLFTRYGKKASKLYFEAQLDGMKGFKDLKEKYDIDCDWEVCNGFIFSDDLRRLEKIIKTMSSVGADCELAENISMPASGAIKCGEQFLFDPLKFLSALPVNFEIFEHTRVTDVDTDALIVHANGYTVKANKIIVATHFPIINSHGSYFLKLRQSTSYTIAVNKKLVGDMYLDLKEDGLSVRPYAGGTLFGGGDHRTGKMEVCGHFQNLKTQAEIIFGENEVTNCWCAEDIMTFDGVPMAGRYDEYLEDIFVITGFNKWGMTNSMVCAETVCDIIEGKPNKYGVIFSPQRRIKGSFGDFTSNALTNIKEIFLGYCRVTFKTADDIPKDSGMVVRHNGKKRAVYRGENDELYVIGSMCPHMHGELKWNADAHTWDCPCHGSRFDIYGKILSEPSSKCCKCEKG